MFTIHTIHTKSPTEALCLNCGLCCNGTLHNWTNLRQCETTSARTSGLVVFMLPEGTFAFRQPCPAYQSSGCVIYAQRPLACQEYTCPLLKHLQSGQITLDAAINTALEAKAQMGALQSAIPPQLHDLPLATQVRLAFNPADPLPASAKLPFESLAALLLKEWGVRWRRKSGQKRTRRHSP